MTFISVPLSFSFMFYLLYSSFSQHSCSQTCPLFVCFFFALCLLFSSLSYSFRHFVSLPPRTYSFRHVPFSPVPLFICHSFLITPSLCFISIQSKKMVPGVICSSQWWQNGGCHQRSQGCHQPPNLCWWLSVTCSRPCTHYTYMRRASGRKREMCIRNQVWHITA